MARNQSRSVPYSAPYRGVAVLLLLLLGGLGYVQAVHVHQDRATEQGSTRSHCSLCIITHSAAQVTSVSANPLPVIAPGHLSITEPQIHSRLLVATASIRPPPQSL